MIRPGTASASYGVAVLTTAAALIVRGLADPWLGNAVPFSTLYAAVAVAVWCGGFRPALLTAGLGYVGINYLLIPPRSV